MEKQSAFLQLQRPEHNNPLKLHRQRYALIACDYTLEKDYDRKGRIVSGTMGGSINLILSAYPSDELMGWVLDKRKFVNGDITVFDKTEGENTLKLEFEQARCVNFKLRYGSSDQIKITLHLTINSPKMKMGNTEYENLL